MKASTELLAVESLKVHFSSGKRLLRRKDEFTPAVDGVSFSLPAGGTFGVVGDTGAGKTVLLKALVGLVQPTAGTITFEGRSVSWRETQERAYRRRVQIVLQNPYTALPLRRTVRDVLLEPLRIHKIGTKTEREQQVEEVLDVVGLNRATLGLRTGQLSGGQRQRVNVSRALVLKPSILLCDEPVSALDVSIKAQVLNLFEELRAELGLTYVFVAHDLSAVRYICDRVAVMANGRFVEVATNEEIYGNPLHPYTRALWAAVPTVTKGLAGKRFRGHEGSKRVTRELRLCAHYPDCPLGAKRCEAEPVDLVEVVPGHFVTMHTTDETTTQEAHRDNGRA